MYFGPSISVGRRAVSYGDSDAQAFIAATGLTGTTEVNAVNNLVANLKSYGLWSKMKAIYPFVSDQTNLLSYTEVFTNAAWGKDNSSTSDNQTTAPNGTTTAGKLIESATTSQHLIYQATNAIASQVYTFSCYVKANERNVVAVQLADSSGSIKRYTVLFNLSNGTVAITRSSNAPTSTSNSITNIGNGWYRITVSMAQGGGSTMYSHIALSDSTTPTWSVADFPSYLGDGIKSAYIWGAQLEIGSTATTYQKTSTTASSVFVQQFKYNLKDARDLDAAFRLAFNGTWTYSKQGATPNGVNGFANTYVNPTTVGFTQTNTHLSAYLRTDSNGSKVDIGGSYNLFMGVRWANNYNYPINRGNNATGTSANSIGYFLASRVDNVRDRMFKNGTNVTNFTGAAVSLDNQNIYIGASSAAGPLYSDRQTAFNTIGDGLTDTEATNLYTSVQAFQTALARQI